jgi:hypothetical protein
MRKQRPSVPRKPGVRPAEEVGTVVEILLPSVKMKSLSPRGVPFEREFHQYLLHRFRGYTVASGSITGYWRRPGKSEECNEHREYRVAFKTSAERSELEAYIAALTAQLDEESIFVTENGIARLIFRATT